MYKMGVKKCMEKHCSLSVILFLDCADVSGGIDYELSLVSYYPH
uniref:Uncharacterized protein n=1 Tax=Anguilla anguilla TaxID=7936 RepID=A0A0E9PBM2_ANGAN